MAEFMANPGTGVGHGPGFMAAASPELAAAMSQRIAEWINTPGGDAVSGIVAIPANADDRKEETRGREYA